MENKNGFLSVDESQKLEKELIMANEEMFNEAHLVFIVDNYINIIKVEKNRFNLPNYIPSLSDIMIYLTLSPNLKILCLDEDGYVFSSNFDIHLHI